MTYYQPIKNGSQVLAHDAFDVQIHAEAEATFPKLKYPAFMEGQHFRKKTLDTAGALTRDVFWSFHKRVPQVAPVAELTTAHLLNQAIMQQMMSTSEWQQIRAMGTANDLVSSTIATIGVIQRAIENLDDKLRREINRVSRAEEKMQELFSQAGTLDKLASQTTDQEQAAWMRDKAAETSKKARRKQKYTERKAKELAEPISEAATAMRMAVREGLREAEQDIEIIQNAMAAFGGNGFSLGSSAAGQTASGIQEKIKMAQEISDSSRLKAIAKLCGRMKNIAFAIQKSKSDKSKSEINSITTGRNIARLLPSEMGLLSDPDLENLFYLRYAQRRLHQYQLEGKEKQGQGPIIVALDSSGSMKDSDYTGMTREVWSKSVMLALLAIARKQQRDMTVLHFAGVSYHLKEFRFPKGEGSAGEILACADWFYEGGTEFEYWMRRTTEIVDESAYNNADVICISDGAAYISNYLQETWAKCRQEREMRSYGILIGDEPGMYTMQQITDLTINLTDLADDATALKTVFSI